MPRCGRFQVKISAVPSIFSSPSDSKNFEEHSSPTSRLTSDRLPSSACRPTRSAPATRIFSLRFSAPKFLTSEVRSARNKSFRPSVAVTPRPRFAPPLTTNFSAPPSTFPSITPATKLLQTAKLGTLTTTEFTPPRGDSSFPSSGLNHNSFGITAASRVRTRGLASPRCGVGKTHKGGGRFIPPRGGRGTEGETSECERKR